MDALDTSPPNFSSTQALEIAHRFYQLDAAQAQRLDSERDQNFLLDGGSQGRFILKISNSAEPAEVTDLQVQALLHIEKFSPGLPVPRVMKTATGEKLATVATAGGGSCQVRLVSYLDGIPMGHRKGATMQQQRSLGRKLAQLGMSLRGFFHPSARHELLWNLGEATKLRHCVSHIGNARDQRAVTAVLDRFESHVLPVWNNLRAQVIHNDANPDNVLVTKNDVDSIAGFIDFGDLNYAPLIVDLAVACAYQLADTEQPLQPVAEMVAAYHQLTPLEDTELKILFDLIATRVAMTIAISSWRSAKYPDNREYILSSQPQALRLLQRIGTLKPEDATDILRHACHLPAAVANQENDAELRQRRDLYLGPSYRLFYDSPLHFVRGDGAWLYDKNDQRYLDVYNNVPHVGHCHPRVIAAIADQAARINTHTRYLHRNVVDYAQRLTDLLPFDDAVCLFCCSGSEANELAYRIAQAHTGAEGVVVTSNAYHGNAGMTAQFSTADMPARLRKDFVAATDAPDAFRGAHRFGNEDLAAHFMNGLNRAIDQLHSRDVKTAMLLIDTIFSCDGIISVSEGFLQQAAARTRSVGGLVVADEVQAGFGRTGEKFWGFERHGITPDIVTLGKPMGNGYPLAAVLCPRAIIEKFSEQFDYFNTFGGSPVACAAGLAVLDVISEQSLQQNAQQVGRHLRRGLQQLQEQYETIGDVRGAGLFIGVELVRNREKLEPHKDLAHKIMTLLRDHQVLIGVTGPHSNVLKLRPPMVFSMQQADLLLQALKLAFELTRA